MDFYQETLLKIKKLQSEGRYEEALRIIDNELSMPYIPSDFELAIRDLKSDIRSNLNVKSSVINNEDDLIRYLHGDKQKQLIAVSWLDQANLHRYTDIINDYLMDENSFDNAKGLLIYSLIEQELSDTFKTVRDGLEYEFIPRYLEKIEESECVSKTIARLNDEYADNPSFLNLCIQQVINDFFLTLPMQRDAEESDILYKQVVDATSKAFMDYLNEDLI